MILTFVIIFFLYILPAILSWRYKYLIYSDKGIDHGLNADQTDVLIVICPVVNIVFLKEWLDWYPIRPEFKKEKKKRTFNSFFKIKTNVNS